jgi:hypothetical protein
MSDSTTEDKVVPVKTEVWKGKGRPPDAIREKVKQATAAKNALRVKKYKNSGQVVLNPDAKIQLFVEKFLENDGNATQAALSMGSYKSVAAASDAGSRMLKRAKQKGLIRTLLERKGYGQGKMIDVALEKMLQSKTPEWWDRVMKLGDYEDFLTKKEGKQGPSVVNIVSAQRAIGKEFGFEEGDFVDEDQT